MKTFCKFGCICFQGFPVFNSSLSHTTLALSTFHLLNTTGRVYGCVMSRCLSSKKSKSCQWRRTHMQGQREKRTWWTQCDDCTPAQKKCTQKKRENCPCGPSIRPAHWEMSLSSLFANPGLLVRDIVGQTSLSHYISYKNDGTYSLERRGEIFKSPFHFSLSLLCKHWCYCISLQLYAWFFRII